MKNGDSMTADNAEEGKARMAAGGATRHDLTCPYDDCAGEEHHPLPAPQPLMDTASSLRCSCPPCPIHPEVDARIRELERQLAVAANPQTHERMGTEVDDLVAEVVKLEAENAELEAKVSEMHAHSLGSENRRLREALRHLVDQSWKMWPDGTSGEVRWEEAADLAYPDGRQRH